MATHRTPLIYEQARIEWAEELAALDAEQAQPPDAVLAGMTPAALRALVLHHAAEEPCERRAPTDWRVWCAEFDRLALALADAKRREAGGGMGGIVRRAAEIVGLGERMQRPDLPLGRAVSGDCIRDWTADLERLRREMQEAA